MRGGTRIGVKPRTKASPSPKRPTAARKPGSARAPAPAPAGLSAIQALNLSPRAASIAGGLAVAAFALIFAATGDRPAAIGRGLDQRFAAMGFKLQAVHVQGASPAAKRDILTALHLYHDEPILGLNLAELRGRVEGVGWVRDAKVVRLLPDTLVVVVDERRPVAVWQHGGQAIVIDGAGRRIEEADASRFPELPLVVGAGADASAPQILAAVAARPRLAPRVEALVRVDDRRWDLRLKDGGIIQLPAVGEDSALIQLDQLDAKDRILDLGFARIDLRNPGMVAVRPRTASTTDQLVANGA